MRKNNQKHKIDHNIDEFQIGQEYVMTLKDQNVLEADDDDFVDPTGGAAALLENQDLQ